MRILDFKTKSNKTQNKLADGVLNCLYTVWEMTLREYRSTLIDRGLNYFI